MSDPKRNVLILCTHNAARSQMAEALMRKRAGRCLDVYSAGTQPGEVHPLARQVIEELGIDMTGHRSKSLDEFLGRMPVAYLITVCGNADAACPRVWPGLGERLHWPFDDPSRVQGDPAARLEAFRQTRDLIDARITAWLDELQLPAASLKGGHDG